MKHLLVTNDFPPKIGGIQSLLWEWWRRLPSDSFAVLTTPHSDAAQFDAQQPFLIRRTKEPVLLPHPWMVKRINDMAKEIGADFVVLDPALPLGLVGPQLDLPYMVVLHGAEITVPGRLPISRQILGHVLKNAQHVIAAGGYPASEGDHAAGRALPTTIVPPGVDTQRFIPMNNEQRLLARSKFGFQPDEEIVLGISRLVPRKGFDTVIRAVGQLAVSRPKLRLVIASTGRDEKRLRELVQETGAPVSFLGRVEHDDLPDLYACSDVFAMMCRNRWGGLEQEGFGIVFVEAASCGIPQVAGKSGGAAEAVLDGVTGFVLDNPLDVSGLAVRINTILSDATLRTEMSIAARKRTVELFDYEVLAARLGNVLGVAP